MITALENPVVLIISSSGRDYREFASHGIGLPLRLREPDAYLRLRALDAAAAVCHQEDAFLRIRLPYEMA